MHLGVPENQLAIEIWAGAVFKLPGGFVVTDFPETRDKARSIVATRLRREARVSQCAIALAFEVKNKPEAGGTRGLDATQRNLLNSIREGARRR